MPELDRNLVRRLAGWSSGGLPVSSLHLDVDGRRYPRRQDYERRAEELFDRLSHKAEGLGREAKLSVCGDVGRMRAFVRSLNRGRTRGVALFSSSYAGLWEDASVPRPLRDSATVAALPHLLPLEALVETYESFCTVLIDREKARVFLARMGRIQEESDILDEVPGQHDQGGWSQARFQRHIEGIVVQHLKRVADILLGFNKRRAFDHLILAGPEELLPEFERCLHDYLRRRVVARATLPMSASADQVLERSLEVEEAVEAARERKVIERLRAEAGAGRQAVMGLPRVLDALNDGRVDTLVVPLGVSAAGASCTACGRLAPNGRSCRTCRAPLEPVADVIDIAVAAALRQRSRVETLSFSEGGGPNGTDVGALLRY